MPCKKNAGKKRKSKAICSSVLSLGVVVAQELESIVQWSEGCWFKSPIVSICDFEWLNVTSWKSTVEMQVHLSYVLIFECHVSTVHIVFFTQVSSELKNMHTKSNPNNLYRSFYHPLIPCSLLDRPDECLTLHSLDFYHPAGSSVPT